MAANPLIRWAIGKALRLPRRRHASIAVEPLRMPLRDGVHLLADRYHSPEAPQAPVVLIRSPYGRSALFGMMAALLAERGVQVVAQSVRGTSGSEGMFNPMRQERDDGADTLAWIKAQPWFGGKLYTFGTSYLGNVQWAMAAADPQSLDGMALSMTLSNFTDELLGFGGFTLGGMLGWTQTMQMILSGVGMSRKQPDLSPALARLPVGTMDEAAFGKPVDWWREWTAHDDPQDPWWQALNHSPAVPQVAAPVSMVAGWQDIFLPHQLRDFAARQAAGQPSWITVGAWSHAAPGGMAESMRDAVALYAALGEGRTPHADRLPVRLWLQEANQWREFPSWPPPGSAELRLHLRAGGRLAPDAGDSAEQPARYTYDPADPTPAVHGPLVMGGDKQRDMAALVARSDTAQFTSDALDADCDVIGPVSVELAVRSDREHTDFFACLCDVDPRGKARQVCDGYLRLRPQRPVAGADGVRRIVIDCWPTAWRFRKGHRLMLIVASGAHPRFARNPGTGEPLATATTLVPAQQEVLLGGQSALVLPRLC
ncbi:MAG: CocE/NonD family hydrolase [Sphingomonadales bacterium]|nr:CocE/NonD family hydrolase [Sphingomonadales bacterium]